MNVINFSKKLGEKDRYKNDLEFREKKKKYERERYHLKKALKKTKGLKIKVIFLRIKKEMKELIHKNEKWCPCCKQWKPKSEFWIDRDKKSKLGSHCKDCQNKRHKTSHSKRVAKEWRETYNYVNSDKHRICGRERNRIYGKKRYKNDPEFREKKKKQGRENYQKRKLKAKYENNKI